MSQAMPTKFFMLFKHNQSNIILKSYRQIIRITILTQDEGMKIGLQPLLPTFSRTCQTSGMFHLLVEFQGLAPGCKKLRGTPQWICQTPQGRHNGPIPIQGDPDFLSLT